MSCTILTCTNTLHISHLHCFFLKCWIFKCETYKSYKMKRCSAVNMLFKYLKPLTMHAPFPSFLLFFLISLLVLFHAIQYLYYVYFPMCMTVYIYMFGSLPPVIDFAELEIKSIRLLLRLFITNNALYFYI